MRRWRPFLAGFGAAVLLALGLWGVGWYFDVRVAVLDLEGSTRDTSILEFSPPDPSGLLADDFGDSAPRNVVLLIGDGMGFAHLLVGRSELVGIDRRLALERMPVTGWLATHARGSALTDSAAAATALASGARVESGRLSLTADGRPLRTLLEAARDAGLATGLVTDSYLWDATPAAFVAHVETRRDLPAVAEQMAASGADLLIGSAGRQGRKAVRGFEQQGYAVAADWAELQRLAADDPARPLLGLFPPETIAAPELPPSLEQLTTLALERLAPQGFFLMIETEETDTGSHHNDLRRVVRGVEALDAAAATVLDFARRHRDTLVLLTSDHETGGLLVLSGEEGGRLGIRWTSDGHTGSQVPLFAYGPGARRFAGARDNTEVAPLVAELLGLDLGEGQPPAGGRE